MREALRLFLLCMLHLSMLNASPFPFYNTNSLIKKLWAQPIQSFEALFSKAIARYAKDREQLLKVEQCERFMHHCQSMHHFLKYLNVLPANNSLVYVESDQEWIRDAVPLFSYWRSNNYSGYPQFYALYFDCLARVFVIAMHESWLNIRKERYANCRTKAEQAHAQMSMVIEHLVGSEYEERYARQLTRYYDILCFAQLEKDKQDTTG